MDGWTDVRPWDTALLFFNFPFSVKYTACTHSVVCPTRRPPVAVRARVCEAVASGFLLRVFFFSSFFFF